MFIACSCVSNYRKGNQFLKPVGLHGVEFIRNSKKFILFRVAKNEEIKVKTSR